MNEAELVTFIQECKVSGEAYRDKFKGTWDDCEKQIRCVAPEDWNLKEDWQSKIFIPQQAKKEEVAVSYLSKMIFPKGKNFDLVGVEKSDQDNAHNLTTLIDGLLRLGSFSTQNKFILTEAVGIGTSFIKILMNKDGTGITLTWRSPYNCLLDPECGHDLEKARFWIDQYKKDIAYIIQEARNKHSIYKREAIEKFLSDASTEATPITKTGQTSTGTLEVMMVVKGIDQTQSITLPSKYKQVDIDECWVQVPNEKGDDYELKVVTLLNNKYILREDTNVYGFIPAQWCRVKPRKYESYARGYVENTRGLQDLANSCINLGFDSLKISSMDIVVINENQVKDPLSIKYKPLAVWKMKDINAVKIQRNPSSAISDVLRGLTIIDQIDQDASGVTRQAQGAPSLGGEGTDAETLGEYQLKLQAIDQRFLDVGRFIEDDYFMPLIKKVFKIIVNPKLFDQSKIDRIIGLKDVDDIQIAEEPDPMTGMMIPKAKVIGIKQISKIKIEDIRDKGDMAFDFKALGITQFTDKLETLAKLEKALMAALGNPTLTALTKIDLVWKKLWQISEIDDYDEFLRSKEEVKELMGFGQMQQQQQMGMPGQPMPGQPPMGQPPMPQMGGM